VAPGTLFLSLVSYLGRIANSVILSARGLWSVCGYGSVDFELTLRRGKKKLNGDLQDYFLGAIELSARAAGRWPT
jgi:hypothetical protein